MLFLWPVLVLSVCSFNIGTKDLIDPGTLIWSRNVWTSHPVVLSSSNGGEVVTMTFNFNPTTAVTNGAFCVTLPSGFTVASNCVTSVSVEGGVDVSISLPSVTLPTTSGKYGPIAIYTRTSSTGNIADMNLNFASVYIASSVSTKTLSVTLDSNLVNALTNGHFAFAITKDLWLQDFFQLAVPSLFTITNPACESESTSATYIISSNPSSPSTLPCYVSGSYLYIYGLNNEVILSEIGSSSLTITLKVSGIRNPSAVYPSSVLNWQMRTRRYGSFETIEKFVITGPSLAPSALNVNSWTSHTSQTLVTGKATYMDLTFTLAYSVPVTGSITFTFAGADINSISYKSDASQTTSSSYPGYYYFSPSIPGSCSVTSSILYCDEFTSEIASGIYILTVLPLLSGTFASVIVTTSDVSGYSIELSTTVKNTYSTTASLASSMSLKFSTSNTGVFSAYSGSSVIGYFLLDMSVDIPVSTVLTLKMPLNSGSNSEILLGTESTFHANALITTSTVTGYSGLLGSLELLTDPVVSSNTLTITLPEVLSADKIYIYFTSNDDSTEPGLTLPTASSNTLTRYEIIASLTVTTEYVYSTPLTIISTEFTLPSVEFLCQYSYIPGMPVIVSYTPSATFSTTLGNLYISIEFSTGYTSSLGSGLDNGDSYPVVTDLEGVTFALGDKKIIMSGLTSLEISASLFTTILGAATVTSPIGRIRAYFLMNSVEYEVMKSSFILDGSGTAPSFFTAASVASTYVNSIQTDPFIIEEFVLKATLKVSSTYTTGYIGIIFPTGFTISSPTVFLTSSTSTTATVPYFFSSPSNTFAFPGIFFALSAAISISTSSSEVSITGVTTSQGASTSDIMFLHAPSASGACLNYEVSTNPTITTVAASFTANTFTPSALSILGPSSLLTTVSASLTMPNAIPYGTYIVLTSAWIFSSFYQVTVTGLTDAVISVTGQVITITDFASLTSGTIVVVSIANVIAPATTSDNVIFSSIYVFTSTGNKMVEYDGTVTCTLTGASSTGISYFSQVEIIPNGVGLTASVLKLGFSLGHSLPRTGVININSATGVWKKTGTVSSDCWSSLEFSSCEIVDNVLIITTTEDYTAGDTISLILDSLFASPSTSGSTTGGFTVTTTFNGITIDADSSSAPSSLQKLTVNSLPSATVTQNSTIEIYPSTIGELASYAFVLSSSAIVSLSYSIVFTFPKTFDPYLGSGLEKYPNGDPENYYIQCASDTIGLENIICKVDHWMVKVSGISTNIAIGTWMNITLYDIKNPTTIGTIGVYILKSSGSIISHNSALTVMSSTSLPSNLIIRSLSLSTSQRRENSTYTIETYLQSASAGSEIVVNFPYQYHLSRDNPDSVTCTGYSTSWSIVETSCQIMNNSVVFAVSSDFSSSDLVTLTMIVQNAEWGFEEISDIDAAEGFVYWTNKLEVGVLENGEFLLKSSGQHGAYAGFSHIMQEVSVNNYSPMVNENYISLKPGTQTTGIAIAVEHHLRAVSLVLTPRNSADNMATLAFSSDLNFTFTKDIVSLTFAVSASSSAVNSLNYIEWALTETSLNGTAVYAVYYKTLVIVYDLASVDISIRSNGLTSTKIHLDSVSLPIELFTENPPYSDLSISFSLLDSSIDGVIYTDSTLKFVAGEHYKYFNIQLNSTFNGSNSESYEYFFTMTGSDVLAYSQINVALLQVDTSVDTSAPVITALKFETPTSNSLTVSITTDTMAVVYWEFCHNNTDFASYGELLSKVYPLTSQNSTNTKLALQIANYLLSMRTEPYSSESWENFQKKMYVLASQTCFYSTALISAKTSTVLFAPDFLWADTTYKVQVFAENYMGNYTSANIFETTLGIDVPLMITMGFGADFTMGSDSVTSIISEGLGVVEKRLSLESSSRRELITGISWVLAMDRSSNVSPSDLYAALDSKVLRDLLGTTYTISQTSLTSSSYKVPTGTFEVNSTALNSITMMGTFTGTGKICCVAELNPDSTFQLTGQQVYLGLDRKNQIAMHNCTDITADLSMVINGLDASTTYNISCISTSDYPIWPVLSDITTLEAATYQSQSAFVESAGSWIAACLGLISLV